MSRACEVLCVGSTLSAFLLKKFLGSSSCLNRPGHGSCSGSREGMSQQHDQQAAVQFS